MVIIGRVHVQIIYGVLPFVRVGWPGHPSRKEDSTINLEYPA